MYIIYLFFTKNSTDHDFLSEKIIANHKELGATTHYPYFLLVLYHPVSETKLAAANNVCYEQ